MGEYSGLAAPDRQAMSPNTCLMHYNMAIEECQQSPI